MGTEKNDEFMTLMKKCGKNLLDQLEESLVKSPKNEDASIYTGTTGIDLMYWYLAKTHSGHPRPQITDRLGDFVEEVCSGRKLKGKRFTFLCGDAGPLALALLCSTEPKQQAKLTQKLLELQNLVYGHEASDELLYGRVGYLYALLFINQEIGHDLKDPRFIPPLVITKLVSCILDNGVEGRKRRRDVAGPPLYFEWHEKEYLGAAHGYVGILYILLKGKEYMRHGDLKLIQETVDWILNAERFESGNVRSSVGSKEDKLVHWCHGAPGAIFLFLEAGNVYGEERYVEAALACGEVVWSRGILKKSYSLCHGVAGNAYALMALYKQTNDEMWLRRSIRFCEWCFWWGREVSREPDRPNSLFEGLAGTVYMIQDFLAFLDGTEGQQKPSFPAFELR